MDDMLRKQIFSRHLRPVVWVAVSVLGLACGDPTRTKATYTSVFESFTVYTLNGAPTASPNALSFIGGGVRASSAFGFDIAFEIDASGKTVIYPVRTLGGALAGTLKRVGLQTVPTAFADLLETPDPKASPYDTVSVKTVAVGTTVAVELRDSGACYTNTLLSPLASQLIYAKMIVDSVNVDKRLVYGRIVFDPNCGYRGVIPDSIPRN